MAGKRETATLEEVNARRSEVAPQGWAAELKQWQKRTVFQKKNPRG